MPYLCHLFTWKVNSCIQIFLSRSHDIKVGIDYDNHYLSFVLSFICCKVIHWVDVTLKHFILVLRK